MEKAAFEEACSQNYARIFSFMLARAADRETARELTQDVFVAYWKTRESGREIRGSVRSYLYGIANNLAKDYWRGKERDPLEHKAELKDADATIRSLEEKMVDAFSLKRCLKRLKKIDQEIVGARFWEDASHEETAGKLGMTHDQVRQRFHRALEKVKDCLRKKGMSHFRLIWFR